MSKQCGKQGRIGKQRTGNQGLEESHGKIKIRQREEKEKEPNELRKLMLYTNLPVEVEVGELGRRETR